LRLLPAPSVIHPSVRYALGQRLLQRIQQAPLRQRGASAAASQQLIQQIVRYRRLFASGHIGFPFFPLCLPAHEIPDSPCHTATGGP
jgi:hypothetical protein